MFHRAQQIKYNNFEKDLVIGYYRLNYHKYISNDITYLSIMFLWFERFDKTKITNKYITVEGLHDDILKGNHPHFQGGYAFLKSTNTFNSVKWLQNYYHWRFKITDFDKIRIGIMEENKITLSNRYVFDGEYRRLFKVENRNYQQINGWNFNYNNKNDVYDLYLDLNLKKLYLMTNNNYDDALVICDINDKLNYRLFSELDRVQKSN